MKGKTFEIGYTIYALIVGIIFFVMLLTGCSTFTVQQKDISTTAADGTETRTITSHTKARTFFDARSGLANFSTTQTDKTQSSKVGSLSQDANGSNAVKVVEAVTKAAVRAALKP